MNDANDNRVKTVDRDANGRIRPGSAGIGGGRPRGSLDLLSVCKRAAQAEGRSLEEMIWVVIKGLVVKAGKGDAQAGKLVLDRFCGLLEKQGVQVNVDIDNKQLNVGGGPPVPETRELGEYFAQLGTISNNLLTVELGGEEDEIEELFE